MSAQWLDPGYEFILVEPSHAGNIGSAARALKVMGFNHLTVVNPRHANFAQAPEAVAFASGALDVLVGTQVADTLEQALSNANLAIAVSAAGREFSAPAMSPKEASLLAFKEQARGAKVVWVFGTERTGLSISQAQQCQALCSIASHPHYGSLNLAQALQVIAYESRQALMGSEASSEHTQQLYEPHPEGHRGFAQLGQVEAMLSHLERTLIEIEFLDPAAPKRLMPRLRRLFSRTRLEQEEIDILRGICARIEKTIRNQS